MIHTTPNVSSHGQPTLSLQCNVVNICEEMLEMIKECDSAIDNLTVQGVIDDELSNKFTTLSYTLKNIGLHAMNIEANIQFFIQMSCNKLQEYRQFYTAMGGKEPGVIYDSKYPPRITVTNKSIYYIEGSVDNIGFVPSISQKDDSTSKGNNNNANTTKKGRSKAKYITMDNTEDNYHLSQIINNNNNNNNNTTNNINADTYKQKMENLTISLREYMTKYENIKKDTTLNNDINSILSYKNNILDGSLINESIAYLSILNCDRPLNQIVQIIQTEQTNLNDYVMNVVQRSKLCREYYETNHDQNKPDHTNGRKQFITSIYTTF